MGQIIVKKDHNLKIPKIILPLLNSSKDEAQDKYNFNQQGAQQTLVYGIQAPLIQINNLCINYEDVISFSLKSIGKTPTVDMVVRDKNNLITTLDAPGLDNEIIIQILPKFDKIYKKINMMFYVSELRINKGFLHIQGTYKSQKLLSSNIKSFGEINTYKLFEEISNETNLGFATNIETNDEDKRYVYCDYRTYKDILDREIASGGTREQVLDYWIDYWNNINLVDIRERYEAKDSDEEMKIWIAGRNQVVAEGTIIEPIQTVAVLNNNPAMKGNELFVSKYNIVNRTGGHVIGGTDKLYSTYEEEKEEYVDYLVQDGDVKKDIYTKFEYMGEVYGKYNYLLANKKRDTFLKKMNSETIEVTLNTPLLGLMRGHKVNFVWYMNDTVQDKKIESAKDAGIVKDATSPDMDLKDSGEKETTLGKFEIDKSVSGQYLIIGCNMKFENSQWQYVVTLSRPAKNKINILKQIEEQDG